MTKPADDRDLPAELVSAILDHSLKALPEEDQPDAKRELLQVLARVHRVTMAEFPAWLTVLLAEE